MIDSTQGVQPSRARHSNLKLRVISAAIGIPVLLIALWIGFWTIAIASIAAAALAGYELNNLTQSERQPRRIIISVVSLSLLPLISLIIGAWDTYQSTDPPTSLAYTAAVALAVIAIAAVPPLYILSANRQPADDRSSRRRFEIIAILFGAYFSASIAMLPLIAIFQSGTEWVALAIFTVFAADTGAYFVGRAFGKRKLAPSISPGKTWEGVMGGIIAAVLAAWLLSAILDLNIRFPWQPLLGAAIALIGVAGDLGESWMKRLAGAKDSGGILPGHGGVLDRTDSLIPNLILIYFVAWLAA